MKILFFTSDNADNLEDSLLHGLRNLFGADVVDYPKKEVLYKNWSARPITEMYANMFTIWKTIDDIVVDRTDIEKKILSNYFDFIIFGSITKNQIFYNYFYKFLDKRKTIMIDGEDHFKPHNSFKEFIYFKREYSHFLTYFYYNRLFPKSYSKFLKIPQNIFPIAFSIPKEKISYNINYKSKTKLLTSHIVDNELLNNERIKQFASNNDTVKHVFMNEMDYYTDIQNSKYGITTKRGGWDCLRHYEIAANGTIICFKNLNEKYKLNAPLGLNDKNCIVYNNIDELFTKIDNLSPIQYDELLNQSYKWIEEQTTIFRANQLINTTQNFLTK